MIALNVIVLHQVDAGIGRLLYGKFNGKSMGNRSLKKAVSALFFLAERHKKRDYKNCNLLILRAETEI